MSENQSLQEQLKALEQRINVLESQVFDQGQRIAAFEKETDITPDEVLQRKDVWPKKKVCDYFEWSSRTFERLKAEGQLPVVTIGGKDFCRKIDLKELFADGRPFQDFD